MLKDKFVEGTAISKLEGNLFYCEPGQVGVYATKVRQTPKVGELEEAYAFVGVPADEEYVKEVRGRMKVGKNWGVVIVPKNSLEGVDVQPTRGMVEERDDGYAVIGILLANSARNNARVFISNEHEIVFASPENFPGLELAS